LYKNLENGSKISVDRVNLLPLEGDLCFCCSIDQLQ
jgi:hypothetical protein